MLRTAFIEVGKTTVMNFSFFIISIVKVPSCVVIRTAVFLILSISSWVNSCCSSRTLCCANALPTSPDVINIEIIEIIKNLKFMTVVFSTSIKAVLRISFYRVVTYAHLWI